MNTAIIIAIIIIIIFCVWYCISTSDNKEFLEHEIPDEAPSKLPQVYPQPKMSWSEHIAYTDIDPSVHKSHAEFVNETSRWSSGAGFTSTTDDNTNLAFTNYVGLNKPSHVPIGASARQVPDIDESVLMRNDRLRWNGVRFY